MQVKTQVKSAQLTVSKLAKLTRSSHPKKPETLKLKERLRDVELMRMNLPSDIRSICCFVHLPQKAAPNQ